MIFLITLTISALLVLVAGLLEIRMPFVRQKPDPGSKSRLTFHDDLNIKDKLIKNSIEDTLRNTRFLKPKMNENIF